MTQTAFDTDTLHYVLPRVYNIRIAVCDDEQIFRDGVKDAITVYSSKRGYEITLDDYASGEDLLNSEHEYNIVILDFTMEGLDGLETAKILREKNKGCAIIFLTSFPHFVYESFEVGTFRFFQKPLDAGKLQKALDDFFELFRNEYPLMLNTGRGTILVQTCSIAFVEASNKKCYINLVEDRLHCAMSMAAIEKLMPKNAFYKVHKGFIVNFNHIRNYDNEFIHFNNGKSVPVSRKCFNPFKDKYRNYVKSRVL